MPLAAGTRVGPYEIATPLGTGGMGEVYRARDSRLGREIAIKALPAVLATEPERLARFEREARLLASLSHPNIAGIYGLEEANGARYLALELIAGESLEARLARGPLPLDEALDVARQIAAGIEAAHESDVIHRDLKPGNVMLSASGVVKVLDFGLAKSGVAERAGSDPHLSASPTMTYAATSVGVILGTAAYMSPEQARGRAVDKRTDVWSFGCVLYECLAGRQAFAGETVSDIVAHILQSEPEWTALPASTPERVRALLARCLEKDAKRRLRDIGDARIELEDVIAARKSASGAMRVAGPATARAGAKPWAAVAITAVAVAAVAWLAPRFFERAAPPPPARFEVAAPRGKLMPPDGASIAISPDGRMIAMIAADTAGTPSLWVRRLDDLAPRRLAGTDGVRLMFWSPDSRWLGFFANDEALSKIAVDAGSPERICETRAARGGSWGKDGTILLAPYSNGGIFRVPASGGTPAQLTHPDSAHGVTGHRFPTWLPDGKHFLFVTVPVGADGKGGLCVGSADGGAAREIGRAETGVALADPGWLLSTRNAALVAQHFDAGAMKLTGDPVVIGDQLTGSQYAGAPLVSVSRGGTLVFLTREDVPVHAMWYDLVKGQNLGATPLPPGLYGVVNLGPDDHRALISEEDEPTRSHLLLVDLDRGVTTRITQASENVSGGVFSKDGQLVAYVDEATQALRVRSLVDGSVRTFLEGDRSYKRAMNWTPDSKAVLYARLDAVTKWDIWLLPLDGGPPRPCLRTSANEQAGQISPDGRWLKYTSDESGVAEACVSPFQTPGLKYQVTIGGGDGGFSEDGKRFYFIESKDPIVVRVAPIRTEPSFSLGPSSFAFRLPAEPGNWDFAHDERRLLRLVPTEKPTPQAATVLQNWQSAVRTP